MVLLPQRCFVLIPFLLLRQGRLFTLSPAFLIDPSRKVEAIFLRNDLQTLQALQNTQEGSFVHDADVELSLVPHDQSPEFALTHTALPMEVVQCLDVPIQFKRSALSLGLLDTQTGDVVLEFMVNQVQQKGLPMELREFLHQPFQYLLFQHFQLRLQLTLPINFGLNLLSFIPILKLEHFALSLRIPLEVLHRLDCPPDHLILRMLHNLPLNLLIGQSAPLHGLLTGDIDPNILVHAQFLHQEGLMHIKGTLRVVASVRQVTIRPILSAGEDHHAVLLVLPIDQPQFLQLAAIVTDRDDVRLQSLGQRLIGGAPGMGEDGLEEDEDLSVVVPVQVESQLVHALSSLILFVSREASRPQLVIFFKRSLDTPHEHLRTHGRGEEGVRLDELEQLGTLETPTALLVTTDALVYDDPHIQINKILRINCIKEIRVKGGKDCACSFRYASTLGLIRGLEREKGRMGGKKSQKNGCCCKILGWAVGGGYDQWV